MKKKEYKLISADNKGGFNTAVDTHTLNGWTPNGNISIDSAGAIFQLWERSLSQTSET